MFTVTHTRSYRCSYHPKDLNGHPIAAESGVQPFVQVKATSAEHAARAAHAVTGCPVSEVVRVEGGVA